jgi:hypothetical protein
MGVLGRSAHLSHIEHLRRAERMPTFPIKGPSLSHASVIPQQAEGAFDRLDGQEIILSDHA